VRARRERVWLFLVEWRSERGRRRGSSRRRGAGLALCCSWSLLLFASMRLEKRRRRVLGRLRFAESSDCGVEKERTRRVDGRLVGNPLQDLDGLLQPCSAPAASRGDAFPAREASFAASLGVSNRRAGHVIPSSVQFCCSVILQRCPDSEGERSTPLE